MADEQQTEASPPESVKTEWNRKGMFYNRKGELAVVMDLPPFAPDEMRVNGLLYYKGTDGNTIVYHEKGD